MRTGSVTDWECHSFLVLLGTWHGMVCDMSYEVRGERGFPFFAVICCNQSPLSVQHSQLGSSPHAQDGL